MAKPKHAWVVRAGNDNTLADSLTGKKAIAIGWHEMGDLSTLKTREEFALRMQEAFPEDESKFRLSVNTGQVYRFARVIKPGDYLLTYLKASREIMIGVVVGEYEYNPGLFEARYPQIRRVEWLHTVSRDDFSPSARNTLGSTLTVFLVDNLLDEIHQLAQSSDPETGRTAPELDEDEEPPFFQEVRAKAEELISDLVSKLDPYDFQDLVAAVLHAMGFQSVSVPPGPDKGIDIIAHPDAFGFEGPRIKAQVKHRKDKTTGPEMRSFVGAMHAGDNGLFVSTGGFTKDAEQAAESSIHPVKTLDRDQFIQLMLEHYEALEPEFKAKIPLRRVWIPAE